MPSISQSQLIFESGNKPIRLDAYLPDTAEKLPTVLALYGSGGGVAGMGEPATMLASQGFAVFVLHYFDRTGTTQIADKQTIFRNFPAWGRLCGTRSATSSNIRRSMPNAWDFSDFLSAPTSRFPWLPSIRG